MKVANIPEISNLSATEKIILLEELWDDLCRHADGVPSPSWHKDVLSERENSVTKGKEKFSDWNTEKERIKKSLR